MGRETADHTRGRLGVLSSWRFRYLYAAYIWRGKGKCDPPAPTGDRYVWPSKRYCASPTPPFYWRDRHKSPKDTCERHLLILLELPLPEKVTGPWCRHLLIIYAIKPSRSHIAVVLVPYPENETFIGRKSILEKLQQQPPTSTSQSRIALFGLGGIG